MKKSVLIFLLICGLSFRAMDAQACWLDLSGCVCEWLRCMDRADDEYDRCYNTCFRLGPGWSTDIHAEWCLEGCEYGLEWDREICFTRYACD